MSNLTDSATVKAFIEVNADGTVINWGNIGDPPTVGSSQNDSDSNSDETDDN